MTMALVRIMPREGVLNESNRDGVFRFPPDIGCAVTLAQYSAKRSRHADRHRQLFKPPRA